GCVGRDRAPDSRPHAGSTRRGPRCSTTRAWCRRRYRRPERPGRRGAAAVVSSRDLRKPEYPDAAIALHSATLEPYADVAEIDQNGNRAIDGGEPFAHGGDRLEGDHHRLAST